MLNHHPCTPIQPFSNLSALSTMGWCHESFVMIFLTVQELSCWTNIHYWKQYLPRCAGGNNWLEQIELQCSNQNHSTRLHITCHFWACETLVQWFSTFWPMDPCRSPHPTVAPCHLIKKRSKLPQWSLGHSPSRKRFLDVLYTTLCDFMRLLVHFGSWLLRILIPK